MAQADPRGSTSIRCYQADLTGFERLTLSTVGNTLALMRDIRVASPCSARWDEMQGDEGVRFCSQCNLNVYNFSAMTEREIEVLLRLREGRLCGPYYRRADGTMITRNCPVGFRALLKRVSGIIAPLLSSVLWACGAPAQEKPRQVTPLVQIHPATGTLVVQVRDFTGAVIGNADILLTHAADKKRYHGKTDMIGILWVRDVPAGEYSMSVKHAGFSEADRKVMLGSGEPQQIQVQLDISAEAEMGVVVGSELGPAPVD